MALIQLGPIVSEIRGSAGGSTFARNRYGNYVRRRTKPVDPGSEKQNLQRTQLSAAVVSWRGLTAAQRDLWNAKALITDFTNRLGSSFHPSGMNLYMRSAQLLLAAGMAAITDPPVTPVIDDHATGITYAVDPGLEINTTIADWAATCALLIWHQNDLPNSKFFFKGPYSTFRNLNNVNMAGGSYTLTVDGSLDADSSMFVKWRFLQPDGSASEIRRGRAFKPPA